MPAVTMAAHCAQWPQRMKSRVRVVSVNPCISLLQVKLQLSCVRRAGWQAAMLH